MYLGVSGTCGTSVPSERLFSKVGEVEAARGSNIKPKNVDMILLLNKNLLCFGIVHNSLNFFCLRRGAVSYGIVLYRIGIPC